MVRCGLLLCPKIVATHKQEPKIKRFVAATTSLFGGDIGLDTFHHGGSRQSLCCSCTGSGTVTCWCQSFRPDGRIVSITSTSSSRVCYCSTVAFPTGVPGTQRSTISTRVSCGWDDAKSFPTSASSTSSL